MIPLSARNIASDSSPRFTHRTPGTLRGSHFRRSHMWNRRAFLRLGGTIPAAALAMKGATLDRVEAASAGVDNRSPEDVASDEFYWREIQEAFTLDRELTNLNNGNSCPSPRVVHDAVKRYMDMANMLPVQYNNMIGRNIGTVRRRLAAEFGCDASELALTRNAS